MLGPLPRLHRFLVCALALVACAGVGAWLAFTLPVPVLAPGGAALGGSLGVALVALLLHDSAQRPTADRARPPGRRLP